MAPKTKHHRPTLLRIEQQMATEITEIMKSVGNDSALQIERIGEYVAQLGKRHPDWKPVLERDRLRRMDRFLNPKVRTNRRISQSRGSRR